MVILYTDYSHWKRLADEDIITISKVEKNQGVAKNVILFIGDGLGPNTITAARIYGKGEDGYLAFEKFPYTGTLKVTFCKICVIWTTENAYFFCLDIFCKQNGARFV